MSKKTAPCHLMCGLAATPGLLLLAPVISADPAQCPCIGSQGGQGQGKASFLGLGAEQLIRDRETITIQQLQQQVRTGRGSESTPGTSHECQAQVRLHYPTMRSVSGQPGQQGHLEISKLNIPVAAKYNFPQLAGSFTNCLTPSSV